LELQLFLRRNKKGLRKSHSAWFAYDCAHICKALLLNKITGGQSHFEFGRQKFQVSKRNFVPSLLDLHKHSSPSSSSISTSSFSAQQHQDTPIGQVVAAARLTDLESCTGIKRLHIHTFCVCVTPTHCLLPLRDIFYRHNLPRYLHRISPLLAATQFTAILMTLFTR